MALSRLLDSSPHQSTLSGDRHSFFAESNRSNDNTNYQRPTSATSQRSRTISIDEEIRNSHADNLLENFVTNGELAEKMNALLLDKNGRRKQIQRGMGKSVKVRALLKC